MQETQVKRLGWFQGDCNGLNQWSKTFLAEPKELSHTVRCTKVFPDGREEPQPERRIMMELVVTEPLEETEYFDYHQDTDGTVSTSHRLFKYTFPDGRVYCGFVQDRFEWEHGISTFVALKDDQDNVVPESMWSDEDLKKYWADEIPARQTFQDDFDSVVGDDGNNYGIPAPNS